MASRMASYKNQISFFCSVIKSKTLTVLPKDSEKATKSYHKIYGILLDIRTLMYRHIPHDRQMMASLARVIEGS